MASPLQLNHDEMGRAAERTALSDFVFPNNMAVWPDRQADTFLKGLCSWI
ncbi:MAG: hypothetical protein K2X77_16145 [Candidatus Obscuribacterales bacterium]|jgi:hypothetical protein|nr:hypothetical protein [Candidatus Obscuribacterales bacterium]